VGDTTFVAAPAPEVPERHFIPNGGEGGCLIRFTDQSVDGAEENLIAGGRILFTFADGQVSVETLLGRYQAGDQRIAALFQPRLQPCQRRTAAGSGPPFQLTVQLSVVVIEGRCTENQHFPHVLQLVRLVVT